METNNGPKQRGSNMNIEEFTKKLELVIKTCPKKTAIMELNKVRFDLSGPMIRMSSTDLTTGLVTQVHDNLPQTGSYTVFVEKTEIQSILLNLKKARLMSVCVVDGSLYIETNMGTYTLKNQIDANEYPLSNLVLDQFCTDENTPGTPVTVLECKLPELQEALSFGGHCAAPYDNTVQGYCGARIRVTQNRITVASQDGWRLSEAISGAITNPEITDKQDLLIPLHILRLIKSVSTDGPVWIQTFEHYYRIHDSNTFTITWADGYRDCYQQFIDYDGFFKDAPYTDNCDIHALIGAIVHVMPAAKQIGNRMAIRADYTKQTLTIESYADGFELSQTITADIVKDWSVAINGQYLLETIKTQPKTERNISFYCEGEEMPFYVYPNDKSRQAVIMSLTQRGA